MDRAFRVVRPVALRPGALEQPRVREERAHPAERAARLLLPHADALRVGGGLPRWRGGRQADAAGAAAAAAATAAPGSGGRSRPDLFVANSHHVAQRIARYYGRSAEVVHPPCRGGALPRRCRAARRRGRDFYLIFGRVVPYKRVDLAVAACAAPGPPLEGRGRRQGSAGIRAGRAASRDRAGRVPRPRRRRRARPPAHAGTRAAVPGRGGFRDRAGRGAGRGRAGDRLRRRRRDRVGARRAHGGAVRGSGRRRPGGGDRALRGTRARRATDTRQRAAVRARALSRGDGGCHRQCGSWSGGDRRAAASAARA